jgi:thiamine-phosphate pyrophosphorylase
VRPRIGRLIVITDVTIQSRFTHEELAELACAGGADVVQLRDKQMPDDEFMRVARRVREICRHYQKLLIVNDRVHAAHELSAGGVHVGRHDMAVHDARAILGDGAVIGTTAGSIAEAKQADQAGADYVGFGHICATSSK